MRSDRSLVAKEVPSLNESLAKGEEEEEGQAYCEKSSRPCGAISKTRTLPEEVFLSSCCRMNLSCHNSIVFILRLISNIRITIVRITHLKLSITWIFQPMYGVV